MHFLFFLIPSLFVATADLSSTDLFALDPDFLNNDVSNPDANLIFASDDGSSLLTSDIWTDDGSELLTFDDGEGYCPSI